MTDFVRTEEGAAVDCTAHNGPVALAESRIDSFLCTPLAPMRYLGSQGPLG